MNFCGHKYVQGLQRMVYKLKYTEMCVCGWVGESGAEREIHMLS